MPDYVLLVINTWSDGQNTVLAAEVKRRHDRYTELASWYQEKHR